MARIKIYRLIATVVVLAIWAMGCASTSEFAKFAQAGSTYALAMDGLLVASGNMAIDANSERLLDYKNDLHVNYLKKADQLSQRQKEQKLKEMLTELGNKYSEISSDDQKRLKLVGELRDHAALLKKYFDFLNRIATSDAPAQIQSKTSDVLKELFELGDKLRVSDLLPARDKAELVLSAFSKVAVSFAIRGVLREELENNNVIQRELATQEKLLKALSASLQHHLNVIRNQQELRVKNLYVNPTPISNQEDWISKRRRLLTMPTTVTELETAGSAAGQVNQAYKDLVSGKITMARLNALIAEVEDILAVAIALSR